VVWSENARCGTLDWPDVNSPYGYLPEKEAALRHQGPGFPDRSESDRPSSPAGPRAARYPLAKEGVMAAATPKPLIQIACICERVLIEPDNVATLVRVVDTFTLVAQPALPSGVPTAVPLTIFVSLKSGEVVGDFEVGFRLNSPEGKDYPIRKWPVELRGGEHGANLKIDFLLANPELGLYWFDVLWGDEILTRIPLRFRATTASEPSAEAVAPSATTTR
jgi:hypothetical protein